MNRARRAEKVTGPTDVTVNVVEAVVVWLVVAPTQPAPVLCAMLASPAPIQANDQQQKACEHSEN